VFSHNTLKLATVALHYVVAGERGTPVVLLHGWPQTWLEWKKIMPSLAKQHRVIAVDLRGLGESTRPADGDYSKLAAAGDIAQLIEALGLGPVHLVGHDMGAAVAYAVAATRPELVRDLVALDMLPPCVRLVVAPTFTRMIRAGATRHAKKSTVNRVQRTSTKQSQAARHAHA
jgi:pimeloyl-ACP methyl ester carboxylesterase